MQSGTRHPLGALHPGPVVLVTTGHESSRCAVPSECAVPSVCAVPNVYGGAVVHGARIVTPAQPGQVPQGAVSMAVGIGDGHPHSWVRVWDSLRIQTSAQIMGLGHMVAKRVAMAVTQLVGFGRPMVIIWANVEGRMMRLLIWRC